MGVYWEISNFLSDRTEILFLVPERFSSKEQIIKKLSPKSLWQTYMKWTVENHFTVVQSETFDKLYAEKMNWSKFHISKTFLFFRHCWWLEESFHRGSERGIRSTVCREDEIIKTQVQIWMKKRKSIKPMPVLIQWESFLTLTSVLMQTAVLRKSEILYIY